MTTGEAVADLQVALAEALRRDAIELDEQTSAAVLEELAPTWRERLSGTPRLRLSRVPGTASAGRRTDGVDEPTAQALNALLAQWGLLDGAGSPARAEGLDTSFALRVTVLDGRQAPISGLTVQATNIAEHAPSASLGESGVSGVDGSVMLRFSRSAFVTDDDPNGHALNVGFAVSRQDVLLAAEVVSGGVIPRDNGVGFRARRPRGRGARRRHRKGDL